MRSSGSHPWRVDENYGTILYLKNFTDQETWGMAVLSSATRRYALPRIHFAPHQTVAIDIGDVLRKGAFNLDGDTPPSESRGKVIWYEEEGFTLLGRTEISSVRDGVAASFSCFYP